ncbi:MAG: hypothetical protein RBR15_07065 [Sphaerochaeta sp.]|nr:hypothetical protein [Sphaerochaeta sp.]
MNSELKRSWGKWSDELHELPIQLKSIAKSKKKREFRIEREMGYMDIYASDNQSTYRTTLKKCECRDFFVNKKGKAPCKHMYRLAYELGFRNFSDDSKEQEDIYKDLTEKCNFLNLKALKKLSTIIDKKFGKEIQKNRDLIK